MRRSRIRARRKPETYFWNQADFTRSKIENESRKWILSNFSLPISILWRKKKKNVHSTVKRKGRDYTRLLSAVFVFVFPGKGLQRVLTVTFSALLRPATYLIPRRAKRSLNSKKVFHFVWKIFQNMHRDTSVSWEDVLARNLKKINFSFHSFRSMYTYGFCWILKFILNG